MLKTGNVSDLQPNEMVLSEKAPVDDKYDNIFEIGLTSFKMPPISDSNPTNGTGTRQQPDGK
jgi:hypothetical protein